MSFYNSYGRKRMSHRKKSELYIEYFSASRPISFVVCFGELCSEKYS